MRKLSRFRPSPAMVVALIALFVALGGVGYAAVKIGTSDIKNGAVTAKKLHNKAATTKKIKNNAVNDAKIADGSVGKTELANGAVGADQLGTVTQRTNNITVPANSARIVSQNCQPGELALSVGANWNGAPTVGPVLQAATYLNGAGEPTGGSAAGRNGGAAARTLTVIVSCLEQ